MARKTYILREKYILLYTKVIVPEALLQQNSLQGVLSSAKDAACNAFTNVTTEVGRFLLSVIFKMHFCKYKKKQY